MAMKQHIGIFSGFMLGLFCIFSTISLADTTDISVWRNLPLIPITFRPEAGIRLNYDLPPLGKALLKPVPKPSDKLLKDVVFPRGVLGSSMGPSNPDPLIPAPNVWLELTDNASNTLLTNAGGLMQVASNGFKCASLEGGNYYACQNNTGVGSGEASFTASGTMGSTSLTITAIPSGSPTPDVSTGAVIEDANTNIALETYIVSGVTNQNPLTSTSACLPSCVVTLNQPLMGTFTGETVVANPATYQANTINGASFICTTWEQLGAFSGPTIDPDTGRAYYVFPGGHESACNGIGVMELDPLIAVAGKQGPKFVGEISNGSGGPGNILNVVDLTVDSTGNDYLAGPDSLQIGQTVNGVAGGTTITGFGTGTGGPGTYTVSGSPQLVSGSFSTTNQNFVSGWQQILHPGRFQDARWYPHPGWGNQFVINTSLPFGYSGEKYLAPNFFGEYTWQATHNYESPGAPNGFVTGSGLYTFAEGSEINAGFFVDTNNENIPVGPIAVPDNTAGGFTFDGLLDGYALKNPFISNPGVLGKWGLDGNLYAESADGGHDFLGAYFVNPFANYENNPPISSSQWAIGQLAGTAGEGCFSDLTPGVVINDPWIGGNAKALVGRSAGTTASTACNSGWFNGKNYLNVTSNINSNDIGTIRQVTLSGTSPLTSTNCGGAGIGTGDDSACGNCPQNAANCSWSQTYDPIHNIIYGFDGSRGIEQIVPNNTTTWTISTASNSNLGTPPPDPTSAMCPTEGQNETDTALQFFDQNGAGFLEAVSCGHVYRLGLYDNGCPSPTASGTILTAGVGRQCFLTDSSGNSYEFSTTPSDPDGITSRPIYAVAEQPSGMTGFTTILIFTSGNPGSFVLNGIKMELVGGQVYILQQNEALQRWITPTGTRVSGPGGSPVGNPVSVNGTQYTNFINAGAAGAVSNADIEVLNRTGVQSWTGSLDAALDVGQETSQGTVFGVRVHGNGTPMYNGNDANNNNLINNFSNWDGVYNNLILGFHHNTPNIGGAGDCLGQVSNNQSLQVINVFASDCDNGYHQGGNNGTSVYSLTFADHNGGEGGSDASATHGYYFSDSTQVGSGQDPSTVVMNGGGSYCERNVDHLNNTGIVQGSTGFEVKERYGTFSIYNYTIAEPDAILNLYSDCQQLAPFAPSCGGNVTLGAPDQQIVPATVTSTGTTATVTLASVSGTISYNGTTGVVTVTVPSMNFLPGVRFTLSGITGGGGSDLSKLANEWASSTGGPSGTTLTFNMAPSLNITGSPTATVQYELPFSTKFNPNFLTTTASFMPAGYNQTNAVATTTSATTFTYPLGSAQGAVTSTGTFTIPGGIVLEVGPDVESLPTGVIKYGDNLENIEGACPVTAQSFTSAVYNNSAGTFQMTFASALPANIFTVNGALSVVTGTGSGCSTLVNYGSGAYSVSSNPAGQTVVTFTGVPTGLTCTSITGGSAIFAWNYPTQSITLQNCIVLNDNGETIPSGGHDIPVMENVRSVTGTYNISNCKVINPRSSDLTDAIGGLTDAGGNNFYFTRKQAAGAGVIFPSGNYQYPNLPYVP